MLESYSFGPSLEKNNFRIRTFSPNKAVRLRLGQETLQMEETGKGVWEVELDREKSGCTYGFLVGERGPFPDPGARFMPQGITGLSQIIDPMEYKWNKNGWKGLPLEDYIVEEVHVGAFSDQGNYAGMEKKLDHLSASGITAVEIMPVAQFYGSRNWGYDGVYIYSPHYAYGTPNDLKHLVDSIHSHGMCAILDVVYNHSGPEGNYLEEFAPFYNKNYKTPWGSCFNLDGKYSDHIREYILQNVIYWLEEFRFDALRLDAVHGIVDHSPVHILSEMSQRVSRLRSQTGRSILLIAESDQNDRMLTKGTESCGTGIDAQWSDDFHHVLHVTMTSEREGYYSDYGQKGELQDVFRNGFLYNGRYSRYLKRKRGTVWDNPNSKLVVCSQNHDQIGNRAKGERLITLAGPGKARLSALLTILSPFTPLLFMGEEIGEESPFLFFVDTDSPVLANAIFQGRMNEFREFGWGSDVPDPSKAETFEMSKIRWDRLEEDKSRQFKILYSDLISIRKEHVLPSRDLFRCSMDRQEFLTLQYGSNLKIYASTSQEDLDIRISARNWKIILDTSWSEFGGERKREDQWEDTYRLETFSGAVFIRG
jgi:maltooligosyltrehalose trehalohydrolase